MTPPAAIPAPAAPATAKPHGPRRTAAGRDRGEIGLGDLLDALAALDPGGSAMTTRIAACLGFPRTDPNPAGRLRGAFDTTRLDRHPKPEPTLAAPPGAPSFPPLPRSTEIAKETLDSELVSLDPVPIADRPQWLDAPAGDPGPVLASALRAPLLPRHTAAGVLGAALAIRTPGNEPDLPRLIAALVQGRPLRDYPRRPDTTLNQGVQVLVDVGESMTPFIPDLTDLTAALGRILGMDRCEVYEFTRDPASAATWTPRGRQTAWQPRRGRPVLLVTDFGRGPAPLLADRVPGRAWLGLERRLRQVRSPLIALLPVPPDRWPLGLARRIPLVHWDPRTTAAAVQRRVGRGHEVQA